jgi:hypothetical protein
MSIFWCVKLKGKRTNVWEKREGTSTCLFAWCPLLSALYAHISLCFVHFKMKNNNLWSF